MRQNKILASLHLIVLLAVIYWNYYSNTGAINDKTIGSISNNINDLFTPAGYAFAIWGIIFLGLIALGVYMIVRAFKAESANNFIAQAAPTLTLAHIGNAAWLWFWINEQTGISVIIMLFILTMLISTVIRLKMELWDAPFKFIGLVWIPISLFFGWISVATIANIAAYLKKMNWTGGLSEITWTIILISVATLLAVTMIIKRNMREYSAVFIWAFIAIAVRHFNEIDSIAWSAIIGSLIIGLVSGIHAYKNKETLPFLRKSEPEEIR